MRSVSWEPEKLLLLVYVLVSVEIVEPEVGVLVRGCSCNDNVCDDSVAMVWGVSYLWN